MMRIFLMGMPGSGKSTLGKELASLLKMPFVDLDDEIEKEQGKSIPEIFGEEGEAYFRQVEARILSEVIKNYRNCIIALGGGTPCFAGNLELIKTSGYSVYLDVSVKELFARLKKNNDRPLLTSDPKNRLKSLRKERDSTYRKADLIVSGDSVKASELLRTLDNLT